jgi:hypothetical protein
MTPALVNVILPPRLTIETPLRYLVRSASDTGPEPQNSALAQANLETPALEQHLVIVPEAQAGLVDACIVCSSVIVPTHELLVPVHLTDSPSPTRPL